MDLARPILRNLSQETGETANLGILDKRDVVFIAQHETDHAIRAFFRPGTRASWHASGIGKAIAASLPLDQRLMLFKSVSYDRFTDVTLTERAEFESEFILIRERGIAIDNEERFEGMRCIAAPVYGATGEVIAGISISGPVARVRDETLEPLIKSTRIAAFHLSKGLGART